MATATKILSAQWDLALIKGDRLPPLSFKIVDFDGVDYTAYEPLMSIHHNLARPAVKTLRESDGFLKDVAVTKMNLTATLPARSYKHYVQVKVAGTDWVFTVAAGEFMVYLPGSKTGITTGTEQKVFKLPIRYVPNVGNVLLDHAGNPILDSQGNFILI